MKNLIPADKRSYFKITFHIMIFSILISLLLITLNNHTESERKSDEAFREWRISTDSTICQLQKTIAYLKAKEEARSNVSK